MATLPAVSAPRVRRRGVPTQARFQILSVSVLGLFGKFDYPNIPIGPNNTTGSRVAVVYGDNGTGKTTILRLIYACLSPEPNRGLRNLLATTPFKEFSLKMSDNSFVTVTKKELIGDYSFTISTFGNIKNYEIIVNPDGIVKEQQDVLGIEEMIGRLGFDVLFVDHNRSVRSTYAFLSELPVEHTFFQYYGEIRDIANYSLDRLESTRRAARKADLGFPLKQVVDALERWFRAQAYRQGSDGEQGAAGVYLEIAKALSRDRRKATHRAAPTITDVVATLEELRETTQSYIRHGLLSEYPFDQFITLYQAASQAKKVQIQSVLSPFLDSIRRRISALDRVHHSITLFEAEISNYLSQKVASFHILDGLRISDQRSAMAGDQKYIDFDLLSSGEKQLIFLLCSSALSPSRRSLIIIDEPELSLNYKWQRLIAGSLSRLSSGGNTQFILASHSIEIITQHVDSSFELIV